ncbi:Bile acid-CoA hydrolase [Oligella ureolytica]|uniref:Bile acid-CoA hydrolase n=1 Tax=Oligella ureolytica TaxID=90244 RepID=A0A378XCN2_9BURK|nr:CaiB/BaiF CoA-transferase family protein [Oligella ureolytica]QPT40246.1 CoA transferase [Oligella ureolytica]SUA50509.1 Bile acid-CoA hydrolase [Oligella ureolytica]
MRPLEGIKVLELGQLIAGPFATKILGEFGAEIIKIEPPHTGDPLRKWRLLHEGTSVWWASQSRNKKSVTVDLRSTEGQAIIRRLLKEVDILVENFRPGALEGWGLSEEVLQEINPELIIVRVSGYGQDGPYRDLPGFGLVGEAMGGFRYLSGEQGRPPVRVGISIGDSLSALHAVIGALMALRHREVQKGGGQVVDIALYESVFNMMESLVAEYSIFGEVRQPAGSRLPGITPSNAYLCADGKYALIAGNGDSIFKRLMSLIGRDDVANDPAFAHNDGRSAEADYIDSIISQWTIQHSLDDVLEALHENRVPAGRVYDVEDIFNDPHYKAREMLIQGELEDGTEVTLPGVLPKLRKTPGSVERRAPTLGQDTEEVLGKIGISATELSELRAKGVI